MASHVPYRLYDTMNERKRYSSNVSRKEASILGKITVEQKHSSSLSSADVDVDADASANVEQRNKARRRRIYENEYNRPYPSRKKIHLWTGPDKSASWSPHQATPQITPSPSKDFHKREWTCDLSDDRPHDEAVGNIFPRELWSSACYGIQACTEQGANDLDLPLDDSTTYIPKVTFCNELQTTDIPPMFSKMTCENNTPSLIVTPKRQTSRKSVSSISPISTVHIPKNPCGRSSINACLPVPSAPIKPNLREFRPSLGQSADALRSHWKQATVEEKLAVEIPEEHKHNESHRKLHNFLSSRTESNLKLYIDDYQVSTFDRIVESFYGNTNLKTLMIRRNAEANHGTLRTLKEITCLFEAVRCVPYLKALIITNAQQEILPILVDNLPSGLKTLNVQVIDGGIPTEFLDTVAQMSLKNVYLEAEQSIDIGRLVYSSTIQTIKVTGVRIPMDPIHMQDFADALSCNERSALKALDLQPWMDFASWKYFAEALRCNTTIQSIRVSFLGETSEEADAAAMVLAELLHANSTLTHIGNYTHDAVTISEETANGPILDALHSNTTLRKFRFFEEDSLFWMAKDALLKRNTDCANDRGECGQAFFDQYVSFAALLPSLKQRVCGYC